ncbi:MAG: recombinase family protein [Deltaproteobacteria bacterium]|nr:recombinase family protein [Deltaproteobacteria bacterium]
MASKALVTTPARRVCAIYTRKSTEEGLDQEFNTLDAQREAGEAYVQSQRTEGWEVSPTRYDDGGYTGANTDRPALQRLLADIQRGMVDVVVVYKIDRLSRSLLDFAKLIEVFDKNKVSLVAVTQQFNTSTSLGRLVLNILLSFAQFEREMIAERTRDKMRAARRKGKWIGGTMPFGYDVKDKKLVINDEETQKVKALFDMYLEHHSVLKLVEHANGLGWRAKSWTTKKGIEHHGGTWTKSMMGRLLRNPLYMGKVSIDGELFDGEHEAIVDETKFTRVAAQLDAGRNGRDVVARNLHGFMLRGLVRCVTCKSAMISSTGRSKGKDYRYYTCLSVRQKGTGACSVRSVPAQALEDFVVERIRDVAKAPSLITETVAAVAAERMAALPALSTERKHLEHERATVRTEARSLVSRLAKAEVSAATSITERLAELDLRTAQIDARIAEVVSQIAAAHEGEIAPETIEQALSAFDEVWDALTVNERGRVIRLVAERIDFDGMAGTLSIAYSPTGLALLHEESNKPTHTGKRGRKEKAA